MQSLENTIILKQTPILEDTSVYIKCDYRQLMCNHYSLGTKPHLLPTLHAITVVVDIITRGLQLSWRYCSLETLGPIPWQLFSLLTDVITAHTWPVAPLEIPLTRSRAYPLTTLYGSASVITTTSCMACSSLGETTIGEEPIPWQPWQECLSWCNYH